MATWKAYILILSVSLVVAYTLYLHVDYPKLGIRLETHQDIINGTSISPFQYRILVPFVTETITQILTPLFGLGRLRAFLLVYALFDVAAIFAMLSVLFVWLRTWFTSEQSLIGVLFVAGTISLPLVYLGNAPWSLLEPTLFCLALLAIYRDRFWPLVGLLVIATLNRETGLFIALTYLCCTRMERRTVTRLVLLLLIWAAVYLELRVVRGDVPHMYTLAEIWAMNVSALYLRWSGINIPLFLGGFWLFALLGYRRAPVFIRHASLLIPVYLLIAWLWSCWFETRLLMTLYPLLIPLGLSYIMPVET